MGSWNGQKMTLFQLNGSFKYVAIGLSKVLQKKIVFLGIFLVFIKKSSLNTLTDNKTFDTFLNLFKVNLKNLF